MVCDSFIWFSDEDHCILYLRYWTGAVFEIHDTNKLSSFSVACCFIICFLFKWIFPYIFSAIGLVCFGLRLGLIYDSKSDTSWSSKITQASEDTLQAFADTLLGFPWWKLMKTQAYKKLVESQEFFHKYVSIKLFYSLYKFHLTWYIL